MCVSLLSQSLNPTFLQCMKLDRGHVFDFLLRIWIEDPDFSWMEEDQVWALGFNLQLAAWFALSIAVWWKASTKGIVQIQLMEGRMSATDLLLVNWRLLIQCFDSGLSCLLRVRKEMTVSQMMLTDLGGFVVSVVWGFFCCFCVVRIWVWIVHIFGTSKLDDLRLTKMWFQ